MGGFYFYFFCTLVGVKDSDVAVQAATQEVAAGIKELRKNTLWLRLVVLLLFFFCFFALLSAHCSVKSSAILALYYHLL